MTLSPRELEVVALVARGKPDKTIASDLRICPSTVRRHIENSMMKLTLKNRVELTAWYLCERAAKIWPTAGKHRKTSLEIRTELLAI